MPGSLIGFRQEGQAMYFKRYRKGQGRQKKTYVGVAHNVWEGHEQGGGQVKPVMVLNLGNEATLDPDQREAARVMAQALYDMRIAKGDNPAQALAETKRLLMPVQARIRVVSSREFGMRLLLGRVWTDLGMDEAFRLYAAQHKLKFPLERVVFGMVLNRLVDPKSKRACNDWLLELAYFPEANKKWDVQHFYRALDVLHDHWDDVEAILYRALWERTPPELRKVWLVDTTSMYFEMTRSDKDLAELLDEHITAELEGTQPPLAPVPQVVNREPFFRMMGHNKDGHPGDPQVVIASVVTPGGQIVRHRVYPGNTNDFTIAQDLIENLPAPAGTLRVWVSDAGTVNDDRLLALDLDGWDRITAEALRGDPWLEEHLLKLPGRFRQSTDAPKFSYRERIFSADEITMARPEKFILVRNALERERQLKKLAKQKEEVLQALSRQKDDKPHGKALCDVASNASLKKFLKNSDKVPGQYVFDDDTYRRELRLAGTRLLRTTLQSWDAQDVHNAYQLLQEVERNHRELKTPLRLRPCYHRRAHRIRAHVMINVLAINCLRQMEQRTGIPAHDLRRLAQEVKAVEMQQGTQRWWQCSELSPRFREALAKLGIEPPSNTWDPWREEAAGAVCD
jgi:hypothetical protein